MERQKFEDSWKDAFEEARVNPSQEVWTNIELDLARVEGDRMKRRLFFYKMVAAASVIFAMCIGGIGVYMINDSQRGSGITVTTDDVAQGNISSATPNEETSNNKVSSIQDDGSLKKNNTLQEVASEEKSKSHIIARAPTNTAEKSSSEIVTSQYAHIGKKTYQLYILQLADLQTSTISQESKTNDFLTNPSNPTLSTFNPDKTNTSLRASNNSFLSSEHHQRLNGIARDNLSEIISSKESESILKGRNLPSLVQVDKVEPVIEPSEQFQPEVILVKETKEEKKNKRKKENKEKENLWASIGFSTGAFNSVNSTAALVQSNFSDQLMNNTMSINRTLKNETEASGITYSAGVNVGGKVSRHWVLQGGLNYMSQNSEYISEVVASKDYQNFMAVSAVEVNSFFSAPQEARLSNEQLVTTVPHTVNNSLQYINIPVQAGYIVLDRDFSVQLNGGISTDLFIQSTVTPQRGNLEEVTEKSGPDSPYKAVNFSGLLSTDFSYRLGDHYRVSLSPGLRYPFSSIYKSTVGLESTPITFDIGLRFRYIFQ